MKKITIILLFAFFASFLNAQVHPITGILPAPDAKYMLISVDTFSADRMNYDSIWFSIVGDSLHLTNDIAINASTLVNTNIDTTNTIVTITALLDTLQEFRDTLSITGTTYPTPEIYSTLPTFTSQPVGKIYRVLDDGQYISDGSKWVKTGIAFRDSTTNEEPTINDIFIGKDAGAAYFVGASKQGYANTIIGFEAGENLSTTVVGESRSNSALGYHAAQNLTTGSFNTMLGTVAGAGLTTQDRNTFIGWHAGQSAGEEDMVGIGAEALSNSTGRRNVAIGSNAMRLSTTAADNVSIGYGSLAALLTSGENSVIGYRAGEATTGAGNTVLGYYGMLDNVAGEYNTAVGRYSLRGNTSGDKNTSVGINSGYQGATPLTGDSNTFLGAFATYTSGTETNSTAIGNGATITASNQIQLGNASITSIRGAGQLQLTSYTSGQDGTPVEFLARDASGYVIQRTAAELLSDLGAGGGTVTGTGTTNYVPKWTSSTAIGNSLLYDDGTSVGVNQATPVFGVDVLSTTAGQSIRAANTGTTSFVQIQNSTTGTASALGDGMTIGMNGLNAFLLNRENGDFNIQTNGKAVMKLYANSDMSIYKDDGANIMFFTDASAHKVGINRGAGTPTATLQLRGSGSSSITDALIVENSSATNLFHIEDGGNIGIGTSTPLATTQITGPNYTHTSGSKKTLQIGQSYVTSSGTGTYNAAYFAPTINQSGTATGITTGLKIDPVLTASDDWRALYITNLSNSGFGIYQESSLPYNYFAGDTGIGTTSPDAKLEVEDSGTANIKIGDGSKNWEFSHATGDGHLVLASSADKSFIIEDAGGSEIGVFNTLSGDFQTYSAQIHNGTDYKNALAKTSTGAGLRLGSTTSGDWNRIYITHPTVIGSSTMDGSAALEVVSTTQGVRFPNMTSTQRDAITAVAGLTIFNTTTSKLETYDGSAWNAHW